MIARPLMSFLEAKQHTVLQYSWGLCRHLIDTFLLELLILQKLLFFCFTTRRLDF